MTSLVYSDHAVIRMQERNITHNIVLNIVLTADGIIKQSHDKKIMYKKIRSRVDNLIAIVLVNNKEILTVMNYFEVKQ